MQGKLSLFFQLMDPNKEFVSRVDMVYNADNEEVLIPEDLGDDQIKCIKIQLEDLPDDDLEAELADLTEAFCEEKGTSEDSVSGQQVLQGQVVELGKKRSIEIRAVIVKSSTLEFLRQRHF